MRLLTLLLPILLTTLTHAQPLPHYTPSLFFHEQVREYTTPDGVRVVINAPETIDPAKPTHLILYALPNGNTIEQTLGCRLSPGLDWHYDIQHIAAQTRLLRSLTNDETILLALLEAPKKSWPAYRAAHKDNPARIRKIYADLIDAVPFNSGRFVSIVAHSGGGGFISSLIDSTDRLSDLPGRIRRIVYLDANYSFDQEKLNHGDALLNWSQNKPDQMLAVFAYDDREITLNGKKVITTPTGGTYRATHRMLDFFSKHTTFTESTAGPFQLLRGRGNHIALYVHPNPENKILHTTMIGEMNAYLEALTIGSPLHGHAGTLGGPRAYTAFVQGASGLTRPLPPTTRPTTQHSALSTQHLTTIPPRPTTAPTATTLLARLAPLSLPDREQAIFTEITTGNVPAYYRNFKRLTLTQKLSDGHDHTITLHVAPDYLLVGPDPDALRVCLLPATAERIARAINCQLPTRKLVNAIYASAEIQLPPVPMTEARESLPTFARHNAIIESQLAPRPKGLLVAGHKKDIVLTNRLKEKPNRVAIYGWHELNGKPIQPLTIVHHDRYTDYSHGTRLLSRKVTVDGKEMDYESVLKHPRLHELLSDEGPLEGPWYVQESNHR